ncbi:MAG: hypothetical protein HXY22_10255 [Alphaproteobacteria bacterium]|nr:hypothetical protein [Alphaproteobacteria bacterium]
MVSPAGPDGIAVDSAELAMTYDGPSQSVLIEQLTLRAEGLSGSFSGQANLTYTSSGSISGIWGGMTGDAVTVNLPGLFSQKLSLDRIGFRGGYDGSENSLDIENASLRAGDFEMSLKGRLAYAQDRPDASPALALEGQLSALKVRDLAAYWPKGMGAGARDWIDANLSTGLITKGVLKADLPVGAMDGEFLPDEMLRLDFSFEGLEANFLSGLTHITEAKGSATLYGDRFEADLESGKVGSLRLTGGAILIDDFHIDYGPGNFKAKAEGEVKDILALIDMQPLGYASRFGIKPEDAAGTASLSLDLTLPLKKDLPVSEIAFDIAAKTNGLGLDLGDGLVLSKGALDFAIDGTRLEAKGPVTMKDIPLDLKWIERFDAGSKPSSNVTIAATLDDAQRASIGFPHMDNVTGPIGLKADLRGRGGEVETGKVTLDLTQTTLSFTPLSWSKSEGEAAAARFSFRLDAKGRLDRIDDLEISGRKLAVSGDLDFDAEGSLTAAEFPLVNLGARNDFRAAVARRDNGFLITFAGRSADLSGAIAKMFADGEEDGGDESKAPATPAEEASAATPLTLDGSLDQLYLRGTAAMTGVRLRSRHESGELAELVLTGALSRGGAASIAIRQKSGRREMAVETANAGELVEGITGFESMKGGNLNLTASLDAGKTSTATASGKLRVDKFRIVDQPFLARLFAAGSLVGISDLLRGEGIAFDRLDVPFSRKDERWSIEDAKASGPSIGLTAEGSLGANGGINIVGTLVPIYGINSILDGIPLIGDILTSREGEGILGMTYAVRGSSDDLRISVNPLSAIAPGIFRRIFEYSDSPSASTNDRSRSATP